MTDQRAALGGSATRTGSRRTARAQDSALAGWSPLPATRVLDIGAPDSRLADELAAAGAEHYLALVDPALLAGVRLHAGVGGHRFHALEDVSVLRRCSADLLVLRSAHARVTWAWGELQHFRWLAVERGAGREAGLAARIATARGRIAPRGAWKAGGVVFDVYELDRIVEREARIYLSPAWGVTGLARRLADEGIDHAVLRWFETLPAIEPGEDLDILVADADAERFRDLVASEPGTMPIDLYSVSGLEDSDFRGAAYYVPQLAERILANAVVHASGMRVPAPEDHLHSLAYHAVYHKGAASGLASALVATDRDPEHDYALALAAAADRCGLQIPTELEALDEHLATVGWRPPADALRRLAVHNDWLARRIRTAEPVTDPFVRTEGGAEPAVFLVRERAVEELGADAVVAVLARWGFEVLATRMLDEEARAHAARELRGGNWGPGPYPVSGGRPALVLACVHYAPGAVPAALRERYPHLTNADVFFAKQELRDVIERRLGPERAFNGIHSADDPREAWHYLEVAAPDGVTEVRAELASRIRQQQPGTDVVRTLSRGRRARVDVVRTETGGPAVRKTYTAGATRHLQREVGAMTALAATVPAVPPVVHSDRQSLTLPLFEDLLAAAPRPLPVPILREMVAVLRQIRAAGHVLVDAKPDNFVLDRRTGLRIVDLEFAYASPTAFAPLAHGPEFQEPDGAEFPDVPAGDSDYRTRWLPHTGMPVAVLLHGRPFVQRAHRLLFIARRATVAPGSPLRTRLRGLRAPARAAKRAARTLIERRAWGTAATGDGA